MSTCENCKVLEKQVKELKAKLNAAIEGLKEIKQIPLIKLTNVFDLSDIADKTLNDCSH